MNSRSTRVVIRIIATLSLMIPITLIAQVQRDIAPLKPWPAPLYWQPTFAESQAAAKQDTVEGLSTDTTLAATPVGSLVFVAVTPCRIADTRDATFPAGFGPPSLGANTTRTMQLQPIHFEYKPDNALSLPSDGDHVGFSAQEVQKVILEAVTTSDKGYLLINSDPMIWAMLNAIKEQQQIDALRTANETLNERLRALEGERQ